MKRIALFVVAASLTGALAASPSHAIVGAWADGTGITEPGLLAETLTVAVQRVDDVVGPAGFIVYSLGSAPVPISIQCAQWSTSTPFVSLHASGIDTQGQTWYVTVRDSGPGQISDSFAITTAANAGGLCNAPESGFKAVPGGSYVVGYA